MKGWEDSALDWPARMAALRSAAATGDVKRLGAWLDAQEDDARAALWSVAVAAGVDLPEDATSWPGKKLLRRALGREADAHVRSTPIARDEAFDCDFCGRPVPPHGRTARDHCPFCLRSVHVDVIPGDRAAGCGGRLDPIDVALGGDRVTLRWKCARCGAERVNRALLDGEVPDDWAQIVALSARAGTR